MGAERGHKDTELHGTCSAHSPALCCMKHAQYVCVALSKKNISYNNRRKIQTNLLTFIAAIIIPEMTL